MLRILHLDYFFDQPLHDVALVIDRKLNRDGREHLPLSGRLRGASLLLPEIAPDHFITVTSITGKNQQDEEIRDQERPIKKVEAVEARESVVKNRLYELIRRSR